MKSKNFKKYLHERSRVYTHKLENFNEFDNQSYEYFKNLTKADAGYYSNQILDYNLDVADKIGEYCDNHNWEEILDMYFKRVITGMRLANTYDISYTNGNSKPDQFGFYSPMLIGAAFLKLIAEYNIQIGNKEEFYNSCGGNINITKKLGYGHTAEAWLINKMHIYVDDEGILSFIFTCNSEHDEEFHSEFDDIAKDIKEKMKEYKKKDFFKKPIFEQIFDDVI